MKLLLVQPSSASRLSSKKLVMSCTGFGWIMGRKSWLPSRLGSSCNPRPFGSVLVLSSSEVYAPGCPPDSSRHHQIESKTVLRGTRVRMRRQRCSLPSAFLNAFSLFHSCVRISAMRDGPSLFSDYSRFMTLTPRKNASFAFSSMYCAVDDLSSRRMVNDARDVA